MSAADASARNGKAASAAPAPSRPRVWFDQHLHGLAFSLGRALRKPWATLLTIAVMGLALALPLGLSIVMDNLRHFAGSVQQSREINLFLRMDVDAAAAAKLAETLRARGDVAGVDLRTPEQALAGFDVSATVIGQIVAGHGIVCTTPDGEAYQPPLAGYDHFAS